MGAADPVGMATIASTASPQAAAPRYNPWPRGIAWLLLLGPLFFLSYGYANGAAAARGVSLSLYWPWERQIPFLPWTIVPYWSIDLFYGLSFLCCRSAAATDRHALRLLTAQVLSIGAFLLWPLRFAFERPVADGLFGAMFTALAQFDQPYNQAPSLHISLLIVIWTQFAALRAAWPWRMLIHGWALLIAVSVLTTWQHHLIDVPTGAAVGLLCLWLWPDDPAHSPWRRARPASVQAGAARRRLARRYAAGALLALGGMLIAGFGAVALLLGWVAVALALVAWNHAWCGAAGFQQDHHGHPTRAARWLLAPYTLGARLNARLWTWSHRAPTLIADHVWLGPLPTTAELRAPRHVPQRLLQLCAELPTPRRDPADQRAGSTQARAWLDLVPAGAAELLTAARELERLQQTGPVQAACALGCSRSAAVVALWLRLSGHAASVTEAVAQLRQRRPQIVLGADWLAALADAEALIAPATAASSAPPEHAFAETMPLLAASATPAPASAPTSASTSAAADAALQVAHAAAVLGSSRTLALIGLVLLPISAIALLVPMRLPARIGWALALLAGLLHGWYAWRVALDAAVLRLWARRWSAGAGATAQIDQDLQGFDQLLARTRGRSKPAAPPRPLAPRLDGALRLWRRQLQMLALQVAAMLAALLLGSLR